MALARLAHTRTRVDEKGISAQRSHACALHAADMARTDHEAHGEAVGPVSCEDEDDVAAQQRVRNEHVAWRRDVEVGAASWAWRLVLLAPGRGTIASNGSVFVWCQDLVAHGHLGLEPP